MHGYRTGVSYGKCICVWLSGSGGDCTTNTANPLLPLLFAPAFACGVAAVRLETILAETCGWEHDPTALNRGLLLLTKHQYFIAHRQAKSND